jgi:hypothetical protein
MGGWSYSDKLAVALACLAGVMALVLFWVDKTPWAAGISVAVIAGLIVYPVIHFVRSPSSRVVVFIVAFLLIFFFGWKIWPQKKSAATGVSSQIPSPEVSRGKATQGAAAVQATPPAQTSQAPRVTPLRKHRSTPNTSAPVAPTQTITADHGIAIGGNAQVSSPTVNNFAPPDRHLNEQQKTAILSVIDTFPSGIKLQVYTSQASEPFAFGKEIAALAPKPDKGEDLIVVLEPLPKGTYILINNKDDPSFTYAKALGNALANHGIPVTSFEPHSYIGKGLIRLVISEL